MSLVRFHNTVLAATSIASFPYARNFLVSKSLSWLCSFWTPTIISDLTTTEPLHPNDLCHFSFSSFDSPIFKVIGTKMLPTLFYSNVSCCRRFHYQIKMKKYCRFKLFLFAYFHDIFFNFSLSHVCLCPSFCPTFVLSCFCPCPLFVCPTFVCPTFVLVTF